MPRPTDAADSGVGSSHAGEFANSACPRLSARPRRMAAYQRDVKLRELRCGVARARQCVRRFPPAQRHRGNAERPVCDNLLGQVTGRDVPCRSGVWLPVMRSCSGALPPRCRPLRPPRGPEVSLAIVTESGSPQFDAVTSAAFTRLDNAEGCAVPAASVARQAPGVSWR